MRYYNLFTLCSLSAALALVGCRSKLDVKTKSGAMPADLCADPKTATDPSCAPEPEPEPEPEPDPVKADPVLDKDAQAMQLDGNKVYFQTRDVITIKVKREMIEGASSYKLTNITNGEDKAVEMAAGEPQFGQSASGGFELTEFGSEYVMFRFFPNAADRKDKFFYGKNVIKVLADDNVQPRFALVELWLKDFDVFGVAVTSFADNVQVATTADGYQFQGWVNVLSPPIVSAADGTKLVNGLFNMVNPH